MRNKSSLFSRKSSSNRSILFLNSISTSNIVTKKGFLAKPFHLSRNQLQIYDNFSAIKKIEGLTAVLHADYPNISPIYLKTGISCNSFFSNFAPLKLGL